MCNATTLKGLICRRNSWRGGLCSQHWRMRQKSNDLEENKEKEKSTKKQCEHKLTNEKEQCTGIVSDKSVTGRYCVKHIKTQEQKENKKGTEKGNKKENKETRAAIKTTCHVRGCKYICDPNSRDRQYCFNHKKQYALEPQEECAVCIESITADQPLLCGHYIHRKCIIPAQKIECPLCRAPVILSAAEMKERERIRGRDPSILGVPREQFLTMFFEFINRRREENENAMIATLYGGRILR